MLKQIFIFTFSFIAVCCFVAEAGLFSNGTKQVIVKKGLNQNSHYSEPIEPPEVFYNERSSVMSIYFSNHSIENFRVTISSPYNDVDYVVNSSFVTIPLEVDGESDYQIVIETNDGDIFEGTLYADDYQR